MLRSLKIRMIVLTTHGILIALLGAALLYLRATMTNLFFDVVAVGLALLLSVAALILAGLADWMAAFGEGFRHFRRFTLYLLCGSGLLMAAVFLACYPYGSMPLLLLLAAAHASLFSISVFAFYFKARQRPGNRWLVVTSGMISLVFAITMVVLATRNDDLLAATVVGVYLCFVGSKLLFFAWSLHRTREAERTLTRESTDVHYVPPPIAVPGAATKS
ncbi:hypothetical protein ACPOL_3768 [Acidisarcina polymorpha]|uniref:Uncharacterized protein n=1 Tax=Acidisarcina polymorpha TaxID=2211140 RepID=A0A2Z5G2Z5_9BACT|nr:hypothetical protein [Acidisarcina polymorpha]AXC13047.1 hypothetical protein ACPOL_3768 [Acidisarcina polymorpha]